MSFVYILRAWVEGLTIELTCRQHYRALKNHKIMMEIKTLKKPNAVGGQVQRLVRLL